MASLPVLGLLLSILAAGVALLAYGLLALVQALRLRRGDSSLGSISGGPFSLTGRTRVLSEHGTVHSPATGHETLWYEYEVQRHGGDVNRPDWTVEAEERGGRPFGLETAAGVATVDPTGAAVDVDADVEVEFEATPADLSSLRSVAESVTDPADGETVVVGDVSLAAGEYYRLVERRIDPDDAVTVSGSAAVSRPGETGGEAALAIDAPPDRGRLWRLLSVPFVIDDPDGAGARGVLRNRVLVGLLFGLPLVMLALVYLFPPGA